MTLIAMCYHCSECSECLLLATLRAFESQILGLLLDAMSYFHVTVKSCLSTIPFTAHCTVKQLDTALSGTRLVVL